MRQSLRLFLASCLCLTACAGGERPAPQRWTGYEPLALPKAGPAIPVPQARAALPLIRDQDLEVKKLPEVKAPLPIPSVN